MVLGIVLDILPGSNEAMLLVVVMVVVVFAMVVVLVLGIVLHI